MDINKVKESIEVLKGDLGTGLEVCDIWITGTGQSIANYNGGNPKATALFDQVTESIRKAFEVAEFPKIEPYYLFHVEGNKLVLILLQDKFQWGVLVNPEKAPLGLILNIAIPNLIESLK